MKKVLLVLAVLFAVQTASAQLNDIYLRDDVVLSGNQWHFDDYSVIEANNDVYLVITPNAHYYKHLPPFNKVAFEQYYGISVLGVRPYVFNSYLGWYVQGYYSNYFYDPIHSTCITLSYVPVFYNFYYSVQRLRHLNLRYWHWKTSGRYYQIWHSSRRHHDHYRNPHFQPNGPAVRPGNNPHRNGPAVRPGNNPHRNGNGPAVGPGNNPPRNGNGPAVRPGNNPPRNGNGPAVRPGNAPSRNGSGQSVRPGNNPHRSGSTRSGSQGGQSRSGSGHSERRR